MFVIGPFLPLGQGYSLYWRKCIAADCGFWGSGACREFYNTRNVELFWECEKRHHEKYLARASQLSDRSGLKLDGNLCFCSWIYIDRLPVKGPGLIEWKGLAFCWTMGAGTPSRVHVDISAWFATVSFLLIIFLLYRAAICCVNPNLGWPHSKVFVARLTFKNAGVFKGLIVKSQSVSDQCCFHRDL